MRASAEVVRALGGKQVFSPTWSALRQPVTVHNLGGCRMADHPRRGVVNPDGEVFGHPGLYVLDGACLPGATGANPALTITAVAERCMEVAVRRLTGQADWSAPERARAVRRPVPEDAAVASVRQHGRGNMGQARSPAQDSQGLSFAETMGGSVGGSRTVLRLRVNIPDLARFLADPQHLARVSGTVDVGGLTPTPAIVQGGTLRLLARDGRGAARTMRYELPFTDPTGAGWVLRGTKRIGWPRNPWRATTRMRAELHREGGPPLTGHLSLSLLEVLRLVGSLRANEGGASSQAPRHFSGFFVRTVVAASLGWRGQA